MHGLQACLFKYITVAAFRIYLSVVNMPLKWEVGDHALKSHGNYIVDHGKSWKNHGIVLLNFCGNPVYATIHLFDLVISVKIVLQENDFLISQPKDMLWVHKITVSMRPFF